MSEGAEEEKLDRGRGLFLRDRSSQNVFLSSGYKREEKERESPSLISRTVSVDVKHHVYLLRERRGEGGGGEEIKKDSPQFLRKLL